MSRNSLPNTSLHTLSYFTWIRTFYRLGKSYLAVALAGHSTADISSEINLVEIESTRSEAFMTKVSSLQNNPSNNQQLTNINESIYTSISYFNDHEILAVSNDSGNIIIWDINTGKEIQNFLADPNGINKIEFSRSGQLFSSGLSASNPLCIWDIRLNNNNNTQPSLHSSGLPTINHQSMISVVKTFPQSPPIRTDITNNTNNPNNSVYQSNKKTYFTTISSQSSSNQVLCGTNNGIITTWDLRTDIMLGYQTHSFNSEVTAVISHPCKQDCIISSSSDGKVCITDQLANSVDFNNTNMDEVFTSTSSSNNMNHIRINKNPTNETIITEPASVTALDTDTNAGMLLATSAIGGVWRCGL